MASTETTGSKKIRGSVRDQRRSVQRTRYRTGWPLHDVISIWFAGFSTSRGAVRNLVEGRTSSSSTAGIRGTRDTPTRRRGDSLGDGLHWPQWRVRLPRPAPDRRPPKVPLLFRQRDVQAPAAIAGATAHLVSQTVGLEGTPARLSAWHSRRGGAAASSRRLSSARPRTRKQREIRLRDDDPRSMLTSNRLGSPLRVRCAREAHSTQPCGKEASRRQRFASAPPGRVVTVTMSLRFVPSSSSATACHRGSGSQLHVSVQDSTSS
jgi:hypothetical protein